MRMNTAIGVHMSALQRVVDNTVLTTRAPPQCDGVATSARSRYLLALAQLSAPFALLTFGIAIGV